VPQHPTFIEELMAAGRGTLGLFVGNRQAGAYFDFSRRGLVTSFIALLLVTLLNVSMPTIMGAENESIAQNAAIVAILFLLQLAVAAIALRQLKRLDGFVPYLVADNWTTLFLTLISTALVAAGITSDFSLVVIGVVVILIEVNIARFIVTLSPMQIAIFLIAQLVGVAVGLLLIGFLFPLPPEVVATVAGTSG
jgi:hypothetical protein